MTQEQLKEILSLHLLWLQGESKGVRANLRNANLTYANLRNANLTNANLTYANLTCADLRNADLTYANLRNADLRNADLRNANLRNADLTNADLTNADLTNANGEIYKAIMLWNLKYNVTLMDNHLYWGCNKFTFEEFNKFTFQDCRTTWEPKEFHFNYKTIKEHIEFYRGKCNDFI